MRGSTAALTVLAAALTACSGGSSAVDPAVTTCSQWTTQLDPDQKAATAEQLLTTLRAADGVTPAQPSDETVARLVSRFDIGCPGSTMADATLADVGESTYAMERGTFGQSG